MIYNTGLAKPGEGFGGAMTSHFFSVLFCLEFNIFSCRSIMVANNTFQYSMVPHSEIHFGGSRWRSPSLFILVLIQISTFCLRLSVFIVCLEIPFSKNVCHTETYQLIWSANQLTGFGFSIIRVFTGRYFQTDIKLASFFEAEMFLIY